MSDPEENSGDSPKPDGDRNVRSPVSPITMKPPSPETMWAEVVVALNYLTRISFWLVDSPRSGLVRRSMSWFPLIGALIGLFGATVDWVMTQIGLPGVITATFAIVSMLWMTRALHEEEFASLVNQYGQSIDKEQKIGWLKEERSVRYGTLGVILIIIMKIGAIATLSDSDLVFQALIVACCWSRALMVVAAAWLRPIAGDPVADHFQQPPALRMVIAVVVGAVISFVALEPYADTLAPTLALGISAAMGAVVAMIGAAHLRGYNGPLLGTLQQVVELTVLGVILVAQRVAE